MGNNANDVVMVSGCRTAIAKFGGSLKSLRAHQLAGIAMEGAMQRAGIGKWQLDEVIVGDCVQCADKANTARTAALAIDIPVEVPAYTVQWWPAKRTPIPAWYY